MRHPARQLAHRVHLLGLQQLLLVGAQFGDVLGDRDEDLRRFLAGELQVHFHIVDGAVLAAMHRLQRNLVERAGAQRLQKVFEVLAGHVGLQVERRHPVQFAHAVTEVFAGAAVDLQIVEGRRVEHVDFVDRVLDDPAQPSVQRLGLHLFHAARYGVAVDRHQTDHDRDHGADQIFEPAQCGGGRELFREARRLQGAHLAAGVRDRGRDPRIGPIHRRHAVARFSAAVFPEQLEYPVGLLDHRRHGGLDLVQPAVERRRLD